MIKIRQKELIFSTLAIMFIDISKIFRKYNLNINNLVHVGVNNRFAVDTYSKFIRGAS